MLAALTLVAALSTGPLVQVADTPIVVPAEEAPAVARYLGEQAVAAGEAAWVGDEIVPATLDLSEWLRLAGCESGGDWHQRGRYFSGGLQFLDSTWRAVGGTGRAADAPVAEQIERARILLDLAGPGQWPVCSRRIGWE